MESIVNILPAIALLIAGIGLVVMIVMQSLQISNLRRRVDQLTGGTGEGNLEDVLIQHLESVHAVGQDVDELIARVAVLESSARHHFARLGLVRFNPFPVSDTGGNQSFAIALLDEGENGFIITSLHSRNGTRIYAKAVVAGKVDAQLSSEETQALDEARAARPAPARSRSASPRDASRLKETPAPKAAPVVAGARPVAEKPAPETPVPAAATPEPEPDPIETAEPGHAPLALHVESESDSETAFRPAATKGQSKGEMSAPTEDPAEKTGARPGRMGGRS